MALVRHPGGDYSFLPATAQTYSSGVRAADGYHIVHVVLQNPLPCHAGFDLIHRHLEGLGRPRASLCAVELRCSAPYTVAQWSAADGFNAQYIDLVRSWGLFVGEQNPVARTNVAPTVLPPAEQVLFAFSYTAPGAKSNPTFVLSGAAEAPDVRSGEVSSDALRDKLASVLATMERRLAAIGVEWGLTTTFDLYCAHDLFPLIDADVLARMGSAAVRGVHLFSSRPPIDNLEIEVDIRGVEDEQHIRN